MLSGIRPGECLALKTKNVDIVGRKINIEISLTKDEDDKTILGEDTKTETGIRDYPLTDSLREILEPRMDKTNPESLLFTNNGKLISVSTINTHFKKICKNARY